MQIHFKGLSIEITPEQMKLASRKTETFVQAVLDQDQEKLLQLLQSIDPVGRLVIDSQTWKRLEESTVTLPGSAVLGLVASSALVSEMASST